MLRPTPPRRASAAQVLLAAIALVALLVGSLAHTHAAVREGGAEGGCTACALHQTTGASPAPIVCAVAPPPPTESPETPLVSCTIPTISTLLVAPKTSPPALVA